MKIFNLLKNIWEKGFFHVLIANLLFALVAFGVQLLVAKFLSEEELGYIKIFQSYIQILGIIAGMGFSTSLLVLCADPRNNKRKTQIFQTSIYTVLPISIIIWFIFLLLNYFNLTTEISEVKSLFYTFSFVIIIIALTAILTAFFQASREFKKYAKILIYTKIISLIIIVICTYLYGFLGFMNGLWIGLLITLIIYSLFMLNFFKLKFERTIADFFKNIKEHLKIGLHGLGANVFGNISVHSDIILLGFFYAHKPKLIGQYAFATIFITGLGMVQGTIVQVATPFFSKHLEDKAVLFKIYKKYSLLLLLLSILILVFSYIALPHLINFFYLGKFNLALEFLNILLLVWFFRCLNAINVALFTSIGKTNMLNLINIISAVINTLVIIFCIKYYNLNYMMFSMMFVAMSIVILSNTIIRKKNYV